MSGGLVGQQLGQHRLISLIGMGGLASIYLAKHITSKTLAAIKILHSSSTDDMGEQVRNQALMTSPLAHPNIIRVFDSGVENGLSYLVMDYAPNGNLRDRHPRGAKLLLGIILSYVRQIADALQYLHDRNLLHLDFKPENMLVGRRHEILLSNFSLRQAVPDTENSERIAGTIPYMALLFIARCLFSLCTFRPLIGRPEFLRSVAMAPLPRTISFTSKGRNQTERNVFSCVEHGIH